MNLDILVRDALLVPNTPESPEPFVGWLGISGTRIVALGQGQPPSDLTANEIVDGRERALFPGLVNAHGHSHSSLTRGSAEGLGLETWLRAIEREQARLTEEQAYQAALATYCEALLSGTTTLVDMTLFPEAAFRAALEVGLRVVIVPYVADSKPFAPTLERTERLLKESLQHDEMIQVWCGLHDLESCSEKQIRAAIDLAASYRVGLHLHCCETRVGVEKTLARTGQRPVAYLATLDGLTSHTLLAHCVWVDEHDRDMIGAAGAHVVHCPQANLKLGSGIAPVPSLLDAHVNVALGSDGAKANNVLDMFDAMKFASLLHKGSQLNPGLLPAEQVLKMATRNGATALGLSAGALAPGMLADMTLVRLDRFHLQPAVPETILPNLVHAAGGSDVSTVVIGGRIVVTDSEIRTVDQDQVRAVSAEIGRSLLIG